MSMHTHIGTSGWSYSHWREPFYEKRRPRDWLPYYASQFNSVELNNSFYRLPQHEMVVRWAEVTSDRFTFAVKAWRAITHMKRLKECDMVLQQFYDVMEPLREKTGVVLFQLPPNMHVDTERLASFLALLPKDRRHAIEFRHDSWHDKEIYKLLERRSVACCHYLWPKYTSPRVVTADFAYVRFHGTKPGYRGHYGETFLKEYADWMQREKFKEVFCYFNNTDKERAAIDDARILARLTRHPKIIAA